MYQELQKSKVHYQVPCKEVDEKGEETTWYKAEGYLRSNA